MRATEVIFQEVRTTEVVLPMSFWFAKEAILWKLWAK